MAKSTVNGVWLAGLLLAVVGVVAAVIGALIGGSAMQSSNVQSVQGFWTEFGRTTGGVILTVGVLAALGGGLLMFIGWVLAMVVTAMTRHWGWFVPLLVLGLVGIQFFVMLAYVIWGPAEEELPQALTTA